MGGLFVVGEKNFVISFFETLHHGTFESLALNAHLYLIKFASEEYLQTTCAPSSYYELLRGVISRT